jgi:hypothetical protein
VTLYSGFSWLEERFAVLGLEFRVFTLARQVLCHLSHTSSTFVSGYFWNMVLVFFAQAVLDMIFLFLCFSLSLGKAGTHCNAKFNIFWIKSWIFNEINFGINFNQIVNNTFPHKIPWQRYLNYQDWIMLTIKTSK